MSHFKFLFAVGKYVSKLEHYLIWWKLMLGLISSPNINLHNHCLFCLPDFGSVIIELNFPSSLPIRSKCPFLASLLGHWWFTIHFPHNPFACSCDMASLWYYVGIKRLKGWERWRWTDMREGNKTRLKWGVCGKNKKEKWGSEKQDGVASKRVRYGRGQIG